MNRTILLVTAGVLGGCVPLTPPSSLTEDQQAAQWQAHESRVSQLSDWQLRGRFGVAWPDGQVQGDIEWHQRGTAFELSMRGPFGLNALHIHGDLRTRHAELNNGSQRIQGPLETLMREHIGFVLPLEELMHLVRGIPAPGQREVTFDEQARAARIAQAGWEVEYRNYTCCDKPALPGRVRFAGPTLRGTLAVREWKYE